MLTAKDFEEMIDRVQAASGNPYELTIYGIAEDLEIIRPYIPKGIKTQEIPKKFVTKKMRGEVYVIPEPDVLERRNERKKHD